MNVDTGVKYIHFFLLDHFKMLAVWYCSHYLPQLSTTPAVPVANLPQMSLIPPQWCGLTCENLLELSKNCNDPILLSSGACGKMIHENLKQTILWHCPLSSCSVPSKFSCFFVNLYIIYSAEILQHCDDSQWL